jgi:hypothetical protein
MILRHLFPLLCIALVPPARAEVPPRPPAIEPLLKSYCLECHSTAKQKGDLDLESSAIRQQPQVWENVLEQIALGEMPPKKERQFSAHEKATFVQAIRQALDTLAGQNAGDPGPVILRRLSNREYTYSIQDLTRVPSLEPTRDFPEDGAAGEGFTNAGAALVMSPALLTKYLDAAKNIANHMVLTPDGIRFSSSTSPQDWTNETLAKIRALYDRYSGTAKGSETVQQGIKLDLGDGAGRIPLQQYLDALQSRKDDASLSPKYLALLKTAFTTNGNDPLFATLQTKFKSGELTAADIAPWQNVLWRFTQVGHIGKENGPKAWQEPLSPITSHFESRTKLDTQKDTTVYLVASNAGDGSENDDVVWEKARIVTPGRPDIAIAEIEPLLKRLESLRTDLIQSCVQCLQAIASGTENAPPEHLLAWRNYLGHGTTKLEPLLTGKLTSTPDYNFIKGWTGSDALSVLANSSDATVRIPGTMRAHSVATHPSPKRASVIAWKCPKKGRFTISGNVSHAHPECGNGITWNIELRSGASTETLAKGLSERAKILPFGPFKNTSIEEGNVVAIVIGPRDGNHSCDLTAVNLTITDGTTTWDLASDVSPDILKGNPHGQWHFLSQPADTQNGPDLPEAIAQWRRSPTQENAIKVQEFLQNDFPLTSPLLAGKLSETSTLPSAPQPPIETTAPSVIPIKIPATLAKGAEFVVTGRLRSRSSGSVQLQVLSKDPTSPTGPTAPTALLPGVALSVQKKGQWSDNNLLSSHSAPVVVNEGSAEHQRFEDSFKKFRELFPAALCYKRIVPVDEVVTLTLYHREDEHLRRLMLDEPTSDELERLWAEMLFVSEAPLKQVAAFEQLWQFATQDAKPSAFEPMRKPIMQAAAQFREKKKTALDAQRAAILQLAAKAWRRPLTSEESDTLKSLEPRLMLVRILTSPAFLYRSERTPEKTGPVSPHELASRLSHFLWSSAPDQTLLDLAKSGALTHPETLRAETRRMIADERIRRLATEFGCQWLHIRDIATLSEKSERHFPQFTQLRTSMLEESVRFITHSIQSNAPILSLLNADHTFVDPPLAAHYGLPIQGDDWQRVEGLQSSHRGGILGLAATLSKQSGASRTSPILRGNWVSEVLLGERLPRPPKDVPTLPEEAPEGLTERQLIERHSSDEQCSGCHRRIDPIGFALEGFDPIGRWRNRPTQTTLADGTPIEGIDGLRRYLAGTRRNDFLRQFARKLLGYALGRSVQLSDKPLLEKIIALEEPRIADVIEAIVLSPQFRNIRGTEHQGAQ